MPLSKSLSRRTSVSQLCLTPDSRERRGCLSKASVDLNFLRLGFRSGVSRRVSHACLSGIGRDRAELLIRCTHSSRVGLLRAATVFPTGPFFRPVPGPVVARVSVFLPSLERETLLRLLFCALTCTRRMLGFPSARCRPVVALCKL